MKKPGRSITDDFQKFTVLVATTSTVVVGLAWMAWIVASYTSTIATFSAVYTTEKREECRLAVRNLLEFIARSRTDAHDNARESIKSRAEEAWSVAEHIHAVNSGVRSLDETAGQVREALRPIRFNQGRGAYFAVRSDGVEQLSADWPDGEGRSLSDGRDAAGGSVIAEMVRVAREPGGGFVEYRCAKPGSPGSDHRKIAYVKEFKPLGWILGTGEYLDDIEADLRAELAESVESQRFGESGNFFAGTLEGLLLTGPSAGRNRIDATDVGGVPFVRRFIDAASAGGGFVEYVLSDYRGQALNRRLSYVERVPGWDWFVGAGLNVDTLDRFLALRRAQLWRDMVEGWAVIAVMLSLVLFAQRVFARRMARRVADGVATFADFFRRIGAGDASIDPECLPYAEFVELSRSANAMAEARRRSEKELSESEARYKRLVENAEDAIYLADETGRLVDVNKEACDRSGFSREEMLAKYVWDIDAIDTPEGYGRKIASFPGSTAFCIRSRHRRRDGSEYSVEIRIVLLQENGRTFSLGVARDITERLAAENALRASEEQFRSIVESSPMGMHFYRLDEGGRPILVAVNAASDRLLGLKHAELLGLSVEKAFTGLSGSSASELLRKVSLGEMPMQSLELSYQDGRISGIYEISLFRTGDRSAAALFMDISERKRMQALMVQTEKMMSVGGLAAGMAHEINNPLSGILQNVQVARRRLTDETRGNVETARQAGFSLDALREYVRRRGILGSLEMIQESGMRAAAIVRGMLEFSRHAESRRAPADLNAVLDKTVDLCGTDCDLRSGYDFRKIRIVREYAPELPEVPCSRTQIQQVLLNLLRNAAFALKGAPSPTITLRTRPDNGHVRVEVEDNGPGMDEQTRRKAFDPFFTTKPVGEGTGLGLSVSYFIITSVHKGVIEVESSSGVGTRFIILLPVGPVERRQ